MKLKRTIGVLLCLAMLLSLLPMGVFATAAGDSYAADSTAWGTQGNNGWYYMYKLADGTYHEMNFYDSTDGVAWRQNAFASDLSTTVEMFFINQTACYYGENDTRPVYAYKAPASGRIVLTMQTHSTDVMRMQVYVGDKLQKIHGKDELTMCTTGIFAGAMTKTELVLDVSAGEMVYVEFYSTDKNSQRQVWVNEYSVEYLSVKETTDYTGSVFTPNMDSWGTQGNNGWYYMYKTTAGAYTEMNYYDSTSTISWQQNAFASDPNTLGEMFFINQTSFFTGELGSLPVYAYKAPAGGQVKLYFETHGIQEMYAQVYVGDTLQMINGSDRVTFVTTGTLAGGMTATELTLNVKENEMIYIVCGTSGTNRQGWLQNYKVTYLSTNDDVDYSSITYAATSSNWGKQDNNGWFYMYDYRGTGAYGLLDYYDSTASISWQQNAYSFDVNTYVEMLFVQESHYFTGEQGSKPVYAFKAPASGTLEVSYETHGQAVMGACAYVGDTLVQERVTFTTTGTLVGAFTGHTFTAEVEKGDMVYIVCSSTDASVRDGWFRNPSAKYTHVHANSVTEVAAVAPTCETAGNISYFACSCGKYYSDAACTTPIALEDTVLAATGHSYGTPVDNGDGTHTASCACGAAETADHVYTDGICACGAEEVTGPIEAADLVFYRKTLSLQSYIALNVTVKNDVLANYDSWYATFERYDHLSGAVVTETVEGAAYGTSYQLFEYKVSSYQMSDNITVTLYAVKDGVTYKGEVYTESVENFVVTRMAAAAEADVNMATLYADLLTYGAKAQTYMSYNTEALADANLGEYASYVTATAPTAEDLSAETSNGLTGATKDRLALGIAASVQIQLRVVLDAAYDVNNVYGVLSYERNGEIVTQRIEGADFTKSGSKYVLVFDAITAVDGRAPVSITIYNADGTAISETWTYSISSYLVSGGLEGNALATMQALLNYFDSAAVAFGGTTTRWITPTSGDTDAAGWSAVIA